MKKVWVDADACPRRVMAILKELQESIGFELMTVSSFNHHHLGVNHLVVGDEDQATDLAIINRVTPGNIVITQDWGLAAMVLGKRAEAISPTGYIFSERSMDFMLEERHLKASLRRSGNRTKGPAARTDEDDRRFRKAVCQVLSDRHEA
jgi:uncharacterized protein YaiI (UPF0178 family)